MLPYFTFSKMKKKTYFTTWVILLFIAVTFDIITTNALTPDFKYERNPIPVKYGLSMFQFYIYLLFYQVPYVLCFYFHVFHFSKFWKKNYADSVSGHIKTYFTAYKSNRLTFFSFFGGLVNFWGFYFIRVNTIYRFILDLHNYSQIYFLKYITNLTWYDFTVLNKPIPKGNNMVEEFVIWYYFTGIKGNDNIKLIIEILLGFFVCYLFLREYIFYNFNDSLFASTENTPS